MLLLTLYLCHDDSRFLPCRELLVTKVWKFKGSRHKCIAMINYKYDEIATTSFTYSEIKCFCDFISKIEGGVAEFLTICMPAKEGGWRNLLMDATLSCFYHCLSRALWFWNQQNTFLPQMLPYILSRHSVLFANYAIQ